MKQRVAEAADLAQRRLVGPALDVRLIRQADMDRRGLFKWARLISARGNHSLAASISLALEDAREICDALRDEPDDYRSLMQWKEHERILARVRHRVEAWKRDNDCEGLVPV